MTTATDLKIEVIPGRFILNHAVLLRDDPELKVIQFDTFSKRPNADMWGISGGFGLDEGPVEVSVYIQEGEDSLHLDKDAENALTEVRISGLHNGPDETNRWSVYTDTGRYEVTIVLLKMPLAGDDSVLLWDRDGS
jgi:hypothetical protein